MAHLGCQFTFNNFTHLCAVEVVVQRKDLRVPLSRVSFLREQLKYTAENGRYDFRSCYTEKGAEFALSVLLESVLATNSLNKMGEKVEMHLYLSCSFRTNSS